MRYLAMLGADVGVIAVDNDSPIQTLDELTAAIAADPTSLVTAGSSGAGGWDHIRLLMVADATGTEDLSAIRWVQFDGGTDAVTQMMGGQIDVVSTDLGEIAGFRRIGRHPRAGGPVGRADPGLSPSCPPRSLRAWT